MRAPFEPGDVVVCVDDRLPPDPYRELPPGMPLRRGRVYRVTFVHAPDAAGNFGVELAGVDAPDTPNWAPAFAHVRFRKIDDKEYPDVLERLKALGKREGVGASASGPGSISLRSTEPQRVSALTGNDPSRGGGA